MKIIIITLISISAIACWIFWPRKKANPSSAPNNMVCILTTDEQGNEMRIYRSVKPGEPVQTISDNYIDKLKKERS